jgi:universal stress protein E
MDSDAFTTGDRVQAHVLPLRIRHPLSALECLRGGNVEKLTSILVVLDRSIRDSPVLAKSLVLAREFGARIELFSCDAEYEYTLRHIYDERSLTEARQACVKHGREYLQPLCGQLAAQGVEVSIEAACEGPLHEAVVRKVFRSAADLVVKSTVLEPFAGRGALGPNDWQLARACPVPLMLSRGGPWPPQLRFAAAVDVSAEETPGLAEMILRTAEYLRAGCRAKLDILFDEGTGIDAGTRHEHVAALRNLGRELHFAADRIRNLTGASDTTLLALGAERRPDVLVLGAMTSRRALTALRGTPTGQLLNALDCDFILVRPSNGVSPVRDPNPAFAGDPHTVELR